MFTSPRVPLWLKVGWTLWVLVWIPFYWRYYGPQNFLWFCDLSNLLVAVALWAESPLIFSWQSVSILLVQALMTVDVLGRLVLHRHVIGGTEYMFDSSYPLYIRLLSTYHFVIPFILIWALARFRYDRRALALQCVTMLIILPLSWLFGPGHPEDPVLARDINWSWGVFDKPQHVLPPWLYLIVCLVGYPLLLYVPSHLALHRLFGKRAA